MFALVWIGRDGRCFEGCNGRFSRYSISTGGQVKCISEIRTKYICMGLIHCLLLSASLVKWCQILPTIVDKALTFSSVFSQKSV